MTNEQLGRWVVWPDIGFPVTCVVFDTSQDLIVYVGDGHESVKLSHGAGLMLTGAFASSTFNVLIHLWIISAKGRDSRRGWGSWRAKSKDGEYDAAVA
jgi:hypothetical protein